MPSLIKTRKKRSSTLSFLKNMKTVMTLSDRLKLAGIKEFKPEPEVKTTNNFRKYSKKRKTSFKTTTTTEKLRNLHADFFSKESDKNQTLKSKKNALDSSLNVSPASNNVKKNAEETLSVSLDFIKDCKMYRKKFRHPKEDFQVNNLKKKTSDSSIDSKQCRPKEKKSQNLPDEIPILWLTNEKELKNFTTNKEPFFHEYSGEKLDEKEVVGDGLNGSIEEIVKTFKKIEPLIDRLSLGDVAKIDRKYLESVLSLATNPEPGVKKNLEKSEISKEKTKQSTGKTLETKNKVQGADNCSYGEKGGSPKKQPVTPKSGTPQSQKDPNSTRIVRDLTKSEMQFQLRVKKNIGNQRNSEEIKIEKEAVRSKSELSDGRKKRKHRNKILKSNKTDVIEIPFSSEVSKAKDVKELWRRETKKKSENSLTSQSSGTIPENDENPKWKNLGLQSYRILHKLVEEEINKISKKSENKNNTREIKNQENNLQKVHENKTGNLRERIKAKHILNKLKIPTDENSVEEKDALLVKKKLILAENLQNYSTYEGEKNKSDLLSILDENLVKAPKKLPEKSVKKCRKVPDQEIQNWSILNRLEQAFLALGNSNFQDEKTLKTKLSPKNKNSKIPEKVSRETEEQKKAKFQNQPTFETLSCRKTLTPPTGVKLNNEPIATRKKTEDAKFSSHVCSSVQSNERNKRNEPSNVLTGKAEDSLIRRKTYNTIASKDGLINQTQSSNKTNSHSKSDKVKKRFTQSTKKEKKNQDKETAKNKPLSLSKSIDKKGEKMKLTISKNQAKPPTNEKTLQYYKNHKFRSGIPKPKITHKFQKFDIQKAEGEFLPQKNSEEKLLSQRSSFERPVKERSILSMHGNQIESQPSTEKFQAIQEKTSSDFPPKSSIGDLLIKNAQKNFEALYQSSKQEGKCSNPNIHNTDTEASLGKDTDVGADEGTCEEQDSTPENEKITKNNSEINIINIPKLNRLDSACVLTSASNISQNLLPKSNPVVMKTSQEQQLANSRNLFLWEKDIRRYREIVKDIMSQYKRIDGFLKQSERLGISSKKSIRDISSRKYCNDEESNKFLNDPQNINLQEYRRKIITEYQTLPFFEYKQLKRDENVKLEEGKKRNLLVVSDINKELDFDVKDYQPRIKKVLDSQLYVDKESSFIQNNLENKFRDKNLSLQEMVLCHERDVFKKHCLKSYSVPKTYLLPNGEFCSLQLNNQRQKC